MRRRSALAMLLVLAALPVLAHWVRRTGDGRCALDGVAIPAQYRVRIRDAGGHDRWFCCIRCAELWLTRQPAAPEHIRVTDETTRRELAPADAFFVRSMVITMPTSGNRIHVFASHDAAARHAEIAHGRLLTGEARPFATGAAGAPSNLP